jgi:hypothetical protein
MLEGVPSLTAVPLLEELQRRQPERFADAVLREAVARSGSEISEPARWGAPRRRRAWLASAAFDAGLLRGAHGSRVRLDGRAGYRNVVDDQLESQNRETLRWDCAGGSGGAHHSLARFSGRQQSFGLSFLSPLDNLVDARKFFKDLRNMFEEIDTLRHLFLRHRFHHPPHQSSAVSLHLSQ